MTTSLQQKIPFNRLFSAYHLTLEQPVKNSLPVSTSLASLIL